MAASRLRNLNLGPFIISAGLRKDGGRSIEVNSSLREGVVAALITPGPIVVVFHRPTLDALVEVIEADTDVCGECGEDIPKGEGTVMALDFWVFPPDWAPEGAEEKIETRDVLLCVDCTHHFTKVANG